MICVDTYALVAFAKSDSNYERYRKQDFTLADITLVEFVGVMLRLYNEQTADYWYRKLSPHAKTVSLPILIRAVKFRHKNGAKNLSFFDCVGYEFARSQKLKFLTGDKEFENLPGVEFVK